MKTCRVLAVVTGFRVSGSEGPFLGVLKIQIMVYWGLYWGPLTPNLGQP